MNPKLKALQNAKKPTLILTPKPKPDFVLPKKGPTPRVNPFKLV